ncbi:PREDICTED: regulating synaptic membrane exocytosis protein 3-like, partial [Rhagoletis zephyria]|uniref:regulating synaptic membrane exocytosis protein 3-like n=1 Tax=Rhagoletis zephyria TaxID=28612 RepID=UPI0008118FA0
MLPAPYVKVYLVKNRKMVAKCKTHPARRTLDPLFQQVLQFQENFKGCQLHVTVWGDKKSFMGVVQIVLDDVDLSSTVMGWYKLFNECSLINLPNAKGGGGPGGHPGSHH